MTELQVFQADLRSPDAFIRLFSRMQLRDQFFLETATRGGKRRFKILF